MKPTHTQAQSEADLPFHTSSCPLVPDWPENLYPWSKAAEKRAEQAEKERQRRLAYIERYLDRESESESDEEGLTGAGARGVNLLVAYETFGKGPGRKGLERRDGRLNVGDERERERVMPGSTTKGRKSRGGGGSRATTKKFPQAPQSSSSSSPSLRQTVSTTRTNAFSNAPPAPPSSLMRRLILPTSTADARFALFSRKRVRLLAEKLREREEEGVVMCICQGGDDGRAMVRCDRCRVWYHLVCVDIRDAEELGEEWFCFKCVGDDDDEEEEEEEEGGKDGEEEEEEEPGVAFALESRTRTRVLGDIDASNTRSGARTGTGTGTKSKKQQQGVTLSESRQDRPGSSDKVKLPNTKSTTGRKRKTGNQTQKQKQQQQQKVPDFAPAMPDSPVRPGVGDQMLYQHHQMFSLQPSPMPPSPRRRTPGGSSSVSPSRRASGGASGGYGSSSSTFLTATGTPSTSSFFGSFNSRQM